MSEQSSRDVRPPHEPLRIAVVGAHNPPAKPPGEGMQPPASYGYGSNILGDDEVHLLAYVKVLYKRRSIAITAFLIFFLSVAAYTFTATPLYEARVQLLIEKENTNVVAFKEAFEQNQVTDDYYQTQYKILQSRALARRTLDTLKLWDHPRFNPKPDSGLTFGNVVTAPLTLVSGWFKGRTSVEAPSTDENKMQSIAIDRFLRDLTVSPVRNSRLVDVKFSSPDPVLSTNVTNGLAKAYIEQNLEFKFTSTKEASDWLGQQLTEQRKQVETSEQALQRFREKSADAGSLEDHQNIVVQKLTDLNAAVTRAKTERIQKEAAYNQIRTLQNDPAGIDSFPAILSNAFIQQQKSELANLQRQQAQMSEKLGPRHPDMVKMGLAIQTAESKIQAEIAKVVQGMKNDYEQAQTQERSLTAALEQQKRDALGLNRKGIEYGVLARDAASNRQIFDSLLQRTKETGISGELRTSNIRVVDAAEIPRKAATPNTLSNLLLALFGGATLSIGLVFFFEYLDNRIKNPEEVKQYLKLPFLGMVPALFERMDNPLINNAVPAHFSESFRGLRTNLLFSSAEEGCHTVVVTSTGPGEGKTMVASNLAMALAQAGGRVLLMDADMRKPRVHSVFAIPRKPGLSNVLVGDATPSEILQSTMMPGLFVMAAGVTPPNPAELLGSRRFKELAALLWQKFDWIIIDTPPVMAVTDSSVVAHLATGVLFVIGAEMTSRHSAQHALEQLEQARAKFIGAVLNKVDLQHNAYYYAQYYRREYSEYYQQSARS